MGNVFGQCIWAEIKWSREMKSGENKIREPTNLKYPTIAAQRTTSMGIDEGNVSTKIKKRHYLGLKSNGWGRQNREIKKLP